MDMYVRALECENECLREQVKRLKNTVASALIWVGDNIGEQSAKELKEHLEGV